MKDQHRGITIKCSKCKTVLQDENEFGCKKCLKPQERQVVFKMEHIKEFLSDLCTLDKTDDEPEFMREWLEGHEGCEVEE